MFENLVAFVVGLATSAVFLGVTLLWRPRIEIGPKLAIGTDEVTGQSKARIKVVNRTRSGAIVGIRAHLHLVVRLDDKRENTLKVALVQAEPLAIGRYSPQDPQRSWAYRFTSVDLPDLLASESPACVRFRVVVTHARSGTTRYYSQDYELADVVHGDFRAGPGFEISGEAPYFGDTSP